MGKPDDGTVQRHRRFRGRLKLMVVAAGCVVVLGFVLWLAPNVIFTPGRLGRMLAAHTGGHATVGWARCGLVSGIVVGDLSVRASGGAQPWLQVKLVKIRHRPAALLLGRLRLDAVSIEEPVLEIDEASMAALRAMPRAPDKPRPVPSSLTIAGGVVRFVGNPALEISSISVHLAAGDSRDGGFRLAAKAEVRGAAISAEGWLDAAARRAAVDVSTDGFPLQFICSRWMKPEEMAQPEAAFLGAMLSGEAIVDVSWGRGDEAGVVLEFLLRDVRVEPKAPVRSLTGISGFVAWTGNRWVLKDIEGHLGSARLTLSHMEAVRSERQWTLAMAGQAMGIVFDESLRSALPGPVERVLEELGLVGCLADARFEGSRTPNGTMRWGIDVDVRRAIVQPRAFPYRLPPLSGRITYESADRLLILEDVTGRDEQLAVAVDGELELARAGASGWMSGRVSGLSVDDELIKALPERARGLLAQLGAAGGTVDGNAVVAWSKWPEVRVDGEVVLRGLTAQPEAFPFRLSDLSGAVHFSGDRLILRSITGRHGGSVLTLDGWVDFDNWSLAGWQVDLHATDLALDDALSEALPPAVRERWDEFQPQGVVEARVRLTGDPDRGVSYGGRIVFRGCSFFLPMMSRRIDGVTGTVLFEQDMVRIVNVAATSDGATVSGDATYDLSEAGGRLKSARMFVGGLDVNEVVLAKFPNKLGQALKDLRLRGRTDLRVEYSDDGSGMPTVNLSAVLRGMTIEQDTMGVKVSDLRGELHSDGSLLTLSNMRGRLSGVGVTVDGQLALQPGAGETMVDFRVPRVRLTSRLLEMVPAEWEALRRLEPTGIVQATGMIGQRAGDAKPSVMTASVGFEGIALSTRPRVDGVTGTATYVAATDSAHDTLVVELLRATVGGLTLQDLKATAAFDDATLSVEDADWSAYGGHLSARFEMESFEPPKYNGELQIAHIDLESLAAALGLVEGAPSGWLRGDIRFDGQGDDLAALNLRGTCKVDRGRLYELPLLVTVWNVLDLRLPDRGTVTDAYVEFRMADGVLHLDHFALTGGRQPVDISGTIELKPGVDFDKQAVNLLVTVSRGRMFLDRLPIIGWVKRITYNRLTNRFLQAQVTGSLSRPKVNTVFALVTEPIARFASLLSRLSPD